MLGPVSLNRRVEGTCIILAGGQSRRMGENKAFVQVGNVPMFDRVFSTCRKIFSEIIIVTNHPDRFRHYEAIIVTDIVEKAGPLGGLYTGLIYARYEHAFCIACDMPLLNETLVRYLVNLCPGHDAVVPRIHGLFEPLHAVYSKKCVLLVARCLGRGVRQISFVLNDIEVLCCDDDELRAIDPGLISFTNVNTKDDLRKVNKKWPAASFS